jgi:acyl-CoA thioesterase-1
VLLVQMEAPTNMGARYTKAFHEMYPALAREHGVTLLPFLLDSVAGIPSLNQADGVHPNNRGEAIVARTVWRAMDNVLRGRDAGSTGAPAVKIR